jgi:hypothetical protein
MPRSLVRQFSFPSSGLLTGFQDLEETSLAAYNEAGREVSFPNYQGGKQCLVHAW